MNRMFDRQNRPIYATISLNQVGQFCYSCLECDAEFLSATSYEGHKRSSHSVHVQQPPERFQQPPERFQQPPPYLAVYPGPGPAPHQGKPRHRNYNNKPKKTAETELVTTTTTTVKKEIKEKSKEKAKK